MPRKIKGITNRLVIVKALIIKTPITPVEILIKLMEHAAYALLGIFFVARAAAFGQISATQKKIKKLGIKRVQILSIPNKNSAIITRMEKRLKNRLNVIIDIPVIYFASLEALNIPNKLPAIINKLHKTKLQNFSAP